MTSGGAGDERFRFTRRDVLALACSSVALGLPSPAGAGARPIRIGWEESAADPSCRRGVEIGAEEASHLARLLGRSFELVPMASAAAGDDLATTIAAAPRSSPDGPVGIATAPDAVTGGRVFRLPSSAARRRAAVQRIAADGPRAGLAAVDWHASLVRFGAAQLNQRYERRFGAPMEETAWIGWLAVKISLEGVLRCGGRADELAATLRRLSFDGHKGVALAFDAAGVLQHPVYVVSGDRVVGEVAP